MSSKQLTVWKPPPIWNRDSVFLPYVGVASLDVCIERWTWLHHCKAAVTTIRAIDKMMGVQHE
jgi:hypothetical protein